jgi:hypothetical protein
MFGWLPPERLLRCVVSLAAGTLLAFAVACTQPNPLFDVREPPPTGMLDGPVVLDAGSDAPALDLPVDPAASEDAWPDTKASDLAPLDVELPVDAAASDLAAPDVAPDVAPPVELVAGLLGYWRFDEADGSRTMRDSSGRGNDGAFEGSASGTGFITGKFGRAFELTSPDRDFGIRVGPNAAIRAIQRYTLAAWIVRRRSTPSEYCGIISRQIDGEDGEVFNLMVSKDYVKTYGPDRNSATGSVTTASVANPPPFDVWVHVASTFDGSRIRIYYNGVEQDYATWTAPLPSGGNAPVYLATKKVINWAHPFIGALDEVMLYDRELPPEAIAALARGERPPLP